MVRAIDDRYRATPVPLARYKPVAQAVLHGAFPEAMFLEPVDRLGLRLACVFDAVQPLAVYPGAVAGVSAALPALGRLNRADLRQPVCRCEIPVPVVLRGHGHDRAGPVPHQDIVRQVDRDLFAVERVDRVGPRENAALFQRDLGRLALDIGFLADSLDKGHDIFPAVRGNYRRTRGCSGASTTNVMPKEVSGLVVKTSIRSLSRRPPSRTGRPPSGRSSCAASSSRAPAIPGRPWRPAARRRKR